MIKSGYESLVELLPELKSSAKNVILSSAFELIQGLIRENTELASLADAKRRKLIAPQQSIN